MQRTLWTCCLGWVALAFLVVPLRAADVSSPVGKSAAAFLDAAAAGDRSGMLAAAVAGPTQIAAIDSFLEIDSAARGLRTAAVQKWGNTAAEIWPASRGSVRLADAKISESGDSAVISFGGSSRVMRMARVGADWKVDATSMPLPPGDGASKMATILNAMAADVRAGKFASVQAAKTEMNQRLSALSSPGPSTGSAATRPATAAPATPPAEAAKPADPPKSSPGKSGESKTGTAAEGSALQATDAAGIKAMVGKRATVEGTAKTVAWSKSGKVLNIDFDGTGKDGFTAAAFSSHRDALDGAFQGDIGKAISGKKIRVTGAIKLFKDRPEIVIDGPDQITVVGSAGK